MDIYDDKDRISSAWGWTVFLYNFVGITASWNGNNYSFIFPQNSHILFHKQAIIFQKKYKYYFTCKFGIT